MLVYIKVLYVFIMYDNIKVLCVGGRQQCGWQGKPGGGDHGGRWHHDVIVMVLLLLLAGLILILFHLDDVMNLGFVAHIEAVKHLNVPLAQFITPLPPLRYIWTELIPYHVTNFHGAPQWLFTLPSGKKFQYHSDFWLKCQYKILFCFHD